MFELVVYDDVSDWCSSLVITAANCLLASSPGVRGCGRGQIEESGGMEVPSRIQ